MPQSSIIIGVDLVPIKPIPNVITFASDITTEECRTRLRKELKDWKADCVLHDGAPNVGKNWLHDAYSQSALTLSSFKLACEMLKKGGWFVTKIFRSSDYNSLMWVFQQLFEKVHGHKPAASRNQSAEIFVVCQGFKAPDKIDKRFFDVKSVFEGLDEEGAGDKNKLVVAKHFLELKKKKALGYDKTVGQSMHVKKTITEFLAHGNPLAFISECNQLVFDQEYFKTHELTTPDILESCKDIKVLGPSEVKALKKWHTKLTKQLQKEADEIKEEIEEEKVDSEAEEEAEIKELDEKMIQMKKGEVSELKRKKKLKLRALKKLRKAIADTASSLGGGFVNIDDSMFSLQAAKEAAKDSDDDLIFSDEEDGEMDLESGDEDEVMEKRLKRAKERYRKEKGESLIKDFETKKDKSKRQMNMWFTKPIFDGMEDDITDKELDMAAKKYKIETQTEKQIVDDNKTDKKEETETKKPEAEEAGTETQTPTKMDVEEQSASEEEDFDDETDSDDDNPALPARAAAFACRGPGWEFVDSKNERPLLPTKENGGLTPEELAVMTEVAMSKKKKREYIERSFNRYQFDDDPGALPDWFLDDEKIHQRPSAGPSIEGSSNLELVQFYKDRQKGANVRTIKKVAEAKARKRKKITARKERARKSAEGILAQGDMSEREKSAHVKNIYRKAGLSTSGGYKEKREKPAIVVAKRGVGKRVSRPAGVKGRFTVVDSRGKNDLRHKKNREREKAGKGKKKRR